MTTEEQKTSMQDENAKPIWDDVREAFKSKDYKFAIERLEQLAKEYPTESGIHKWIADAYYKLSDPVMAKFSEETADRLAKQSMYSFAKRNAVNMFEKAYDEIQLGNLEDGIETAKKSIIRAVMLERVDYLIAKNKVAKHLVTMSPEEYIEKQKEYIKKLIELINPKDKENELKTLLIAFDMPANMKKLETQGKSE